MFATSLPHLIPSDEPELWIPLEHVAPPHVGQVLAGLGEETVVADLGHD